MTTFLLAPGGLGQHHARDQRPVRLAAAAQRGPVVVAAVVRHQQPAASRQGLQQPAGEKKNSEFILSVECRPQHEAGQVPVPGVQ